MSGLEEAAMRYAEATAEIRRLTDSLAGRDEMGDSLLACTNPVVDERTHLQRACRKWLWKEPEMNSEGEYYAGGGWQSGRERADWCDGCVAIQEIVTQRRAAKRRRAAALSAIGNIARALLRRSKPCFPTPTPTASEAKRRT